jgi:Fe-S cluster biogenesis protein NfuA
MIRSLVKSGIKRVLRMETRPAEYGGPGAYTPPPEPAMPPAPVVTEAPEPEPEPMVAAPEPAKKPRKPRAKKAKLEEVITPPPPVQTTSPTQVSNRDEDDVAGPALDTAAVQVILDEMVRPALQGDGGDITLLRIEKNDIYVKLVGSCSTCPSSILTMKAGVEALLKEEFPSMNQLIQVD